MKLDTLYRSMPYVFVELPAHLQQELLLQAGYIVELNEPLCNYKIIDNPDNYIIYWNSSQSVYVDD